jgi:hypothetical protein
LRKDNADKTKVLEAIILNRAIESSRYVTQRLKDGNEAQQDILKVTNSKHDDSDGFQVHNREAPPTRPTELDIRPEICSYCHRDVQPWKFSPYQRDADKSVDATATLSAPGLPTPIALPSFSVNEDAGQSQTDDWTTFGLGKPYMKQLFEALATWDCLPFFIISETPFLQAFEAAAGQFCSSALVNALLALSIRVVIETVDNTEPPANCLRSKQAFDTAEEILRKCGRPKHLPDIQALGILSIYEISCGRETEAQMLAQLFLSSITDLCNRHSVSEEVDKQFILVRNTTYCGAASLIRYGLYRLFFFRIARSIG